MKNFIRKLMLIMFLGTFTLTAVQAQTVVQIGNGTSTTYRNPLNMYYCYSWNRMLYLSTEIGNAASPKKITKIAFQYSYSQSANMTNQTCYMQATSATSLTTGYINPLLNGATQVWTGTLSCVQGWVEITLSTPYILPAGSNLQIFWHHNMGTYPGSAYTFYYTSATNMAADAYSDASFPSGSSGNLTDIRPNIKITWMPLMRSAAVVGMLAPARSITWSTNLPAVTTIANVGTDTITSCRVNWSVNGVLQTPVNNSFPLVGGVTPLSVNLGNYTPDSNELNNITVWIDNALPYDSARNDDTLSYDFYACTFALNGSYTVGDTNSYFHTLNDALEHLMNCGVSGPTTLLLKNGVYNQALSLTGSIPGISSTNTVTFASYTGNADSVQIYASGTSLLLTQANYLRFRNLTIGTTSSIGTKGVEFVSGATDIDFYGCNIYSYTGATSSTYAPVYYAGSSGSGYQLTDVTFIKNNIMGGYYNMYLYYPGSGSGTSMSSITIDSNIMTEAYYYGIYSYYYGYYPSISYNTINSRTSAGYYYGIYTYYYHTVDSMVGNQIHIYCTSYGYGIYMYYYQNYSSTYNSYAPRYIANNEVFVDAYYTGYGIYGYYYSNLDIYHNSIYVRSRYTSSTSYYAYGFYNYTTSTSYKQTIKYNNVRVESYGYAVPIYIPTSTTTYYASTYIEYDYNNYYPTAPTIYYVYSTVSSTLAGWQNAGYNQDAHSISVLPNYVDLDTTLHTDGWDMLVATTSKVTIDKDKKSRGAITNIGCYHDFDPNDNDVKMTQIVSPGSSVTTGQPTALKVRITNMGLNNLDSVRIHWVVNGIMDSVNYYCNLAFSAISTDILLDSILPISGINAVKVYTTLPNGVQDEFPGNDTMTTNPYGCSNMLNGIYVVGPSGNFADLNEALTALYNCGINGPVVMRFMNGTYSNLNFIQNVPGSSTVNTITFTSFTGNADSVIFESIGGVALTLDNMSNINFKAVTFDAVAGTYGVEFKNTCNNVLFYGCNIKASPTTTSSSNVAVRYYNSSGSGKYLHNVRFIKNNISGGYYNFYLYYPGSGSTEMSNGSASITIDSNTITDAYYYGIYSYYYGFYPSISYNTITSRSSSGGYYGIYTYYYHTIPLMVGNKIHVNCSSTGYGMRLYYYHNYSTSYGSNGPGLLANNEIIINGAGTKYAMYVYNNSRWDIINNSIYVGPAASTVYGIYRYTTSTSYMMNVVNNNIVVAATGSTYPIYISSTTYATPAYGTVDYNNYYSNGSYLGYIGSAMTTLAAMKAYQNTNSVNVLPIYINVANSLELSDYSGMLCYRYTGVTNDIKGEARTTLTPMGAYSTYVFEGYDMGIDAVVEPVNTDEVFCYQDYASIVVAMANKGSIPINFTNNPMTLHVDVQGIVNYQADTVISVGALSATMKDTFVISNFLPVNLSGVYNIKVWLELSIDQLSSDDTVQSVYIIDKISIPYTVNFDTIPNGLVFQQMAGTSGWSVEQGAGINPAISPSHGSGRLQFLSETGRGSMAKVTLQPFNLQGSAMPQMKFWYAHDNNNAMARDYTEVKISVDGGFNYSTLLHIQRYNANYATPTFVRYDIDLSPYTAYSCVIIAFEAGSYGGGNQNIDSIAIISKQDIELDLGVPQQNALIACELNNQTINVSLTNKTAQDFRFENNPSQINVEISGVVDTTITIPLLTGTIIGDTTLTYEITNTFDFSANGTYDILAYLSSADDNEANDTARASLTVNVDAEMLRVDSIGMKTEGDLVFPTVSFTNIGNMPINQIPMSVIVNNVLVFTETIDTLLNQGDTIIYTFSQPYTVPHATEQQPYYQMKVQIDLSCDGNTTNNFYTKYYDVDVPLSVDLEITSILTPEADSCEVGFSKIYPSIEIYNGGTGYAQGAMLYVFVDSLGVQIKSFVESLDDVLSQGTITHTCVKFYSVPDFTGNYTVSFYVDYPTDVVQTNNTASVVTCAKKSDVGIEIMDESEWMLGQNIPNPATSMTVIPYTIPQEGKVSIKVMSVNGQILYKEEIEASSGTHYVELNTADLSNGIYYYSMEYQGQRIVKKMTIQK
ncbi:MAG: T9SS type A sorting domain-containing protein [Bacteroidales bacterium]|nr:T9SS type A sorting domain-containing protein [Bacteroidales bacterium]